MVARKEDADRIEAERVAAAQREEAERVAAVERAEAQRAAEMEKIFASKDSFRKASLDAKAWEQSAAEKATPMHVSSNMQRPVVAMSESKV